MSRSEITPEAFFKEMLAHVPFDGWTKAAMQTTADQLGLLSFANGTTFSARDKWACRNRVR